MDLNRIPRRRPQLLDPPEIPWASSGHDRPRVLLECPPEKSPTIIAQILEREGFGVVVCEGPTPSARCPLTEGRYCSALQGVDVVVNMLGDRRPDQAEVLPALTSTGPRPPRVVAQVGPDTETDRGVGAIGPRCNTSELLAAVYRALDDGPGAGAAM